MYGKVTDVTTGAPVGGICVTLGQPGAICWAITDSAGNYTIDSSAVQSGSQFQLYFFSCAAGVRSLDGRGCTPPTVRYPVQGSDLFPLSSSVRKDWAIHR